MSMSSGHQGTRLGGSSVYPHRLAVTVLIPEWNALRLRGVRCPAQGCSGRCAGRGSRSDPRTQALPARGLKDLTMNPESHVTFQPLHTYPMYTHHAHTHRHTPHRDTCTHIHTQRDTHAHRHTCTHTHRHTCAPTAHTCTQTHTNTDTHTTLIQNTYSRYIWWSGYSYSILLCAWQCWSPSMKLIS